VRASEVFRFPELTIPRACGVYFAAAERKTDRNKAERGFARISMGDGDEFEVSSSQPAEGYAVCARCFGDDDIQAFIRSDADSTACDFCGRRSRTRPIAAPLDEVFDFIFAAVEREYDRAINALGWDSENGGYQGHHWDSQELLEEIGLELPNDDGRLIDILVECLGDEVWCERHPYSLREDERLIGSWEDFCSSIKHERRYFFLRKTKKRLDSEYLAPSDLLRFISKTVNEHELVKKLPKGSLVYRARQQKAGQVLRSPYDFGPPPVELATRHNRMSPAGIVMFYGSNERETAVAEIDDDRTLGIAVGTFQTKRDATVLDLTRLPRRLGFFEQQSDSSDVDRYALEFLHRFVKSLAAKLKPDAQEHIDYVPTQVVTEWFRTAFRHRGKAIDGVRYMSAQRAGGRSLVLFADRHDVALNPRQMKELAKVLKIEEWEIRSKHEKAWLKLVRKRIKREP
jgi:HEPN/RES N-terminal domain 1/RES domain